MSSKTHSRGGQRLRGAGESSDAGPALPIAPLDGAATGPAEIITTDAALAELLADLRRTGSFAYDSEFIGESSYHPKLCVLQVATPARVALIDPLASLDLQPFWALLADATVEKIVHAGAQDIEPVARLSVARAQNIFDTQIGAGFVAMAYPTSLQKLTLELTGIFLPKGLSFTDWAQRPLSPKQLHYAADDVRYLPAAATELKRRLAHTGHLAWVRSECDALCDPEQYVFNADKALDKVRGAGVLDARQRNILRALFIWRDGAARRADLPARALLKDEVLVEMCRMPSTTAAELTRIRGLPRPVVASEGAAIVEATADALAAKVVRDEIRHAPEPSPSERFRADALYTAAQAICINQSIDPALAASRGDIGDFYRQLTDGTDIAALAVMQGWRKTALGDRLVALFAGDAVTLSLPVVTKRPPVVK